MPQNRLPADPSVVADVTNVSSRSRSSRSRSSGSRGSVRDSMKVSSDPRAARTREAIITAMHELTASSDAPLTVSALVDRAGISRSSFYAQFANVDELALAVLRGALAEIAVAGDVLRDAPEVDEAAVVRTAITRLLDHVDGNRVLYTSVLNLPVSNREAVMALEAELRKVIPLRLPGGPVEHDVAAAYIAGGTVAVLGGWLHHRCAGTKAEVTEQLLALLPSWMAGPTRRPR